MLRKNVKNIGSIIICVAMLASLAACQKSPDSSLVVNKDIDKLIEEATTPDTDKIDIEDLDELKSTTYTANIENESLGVRINANAEVDIPQTDKLVMLHIQKHRISQEFADKLIKELMGDRELYDGGAVFESTRSELEVLISGLRNSINDADTDEVTKNEYIGLIDKLEDQYNNSTVGIPYDKYKTDGLFHTAAELHSKYPSNDMYLRENEVDSNSELLYLINKNDRGMCSTIHIENNNTSGNFISFRCSPSTYSNCMDGSATVFSSTDLALGIVSPEELDLDTPNVKSSYIEQNKVNLSEDEAIKVADKFLGKMGLEDFVYSEGGLYTEKTSAKMIDSGKTPLFFRSYYIFRYVRSIDGMAMNYSIHGKEESGWDGNDSFYRYEWPEECIEFRINDDGIVGFDYISPIEVTKTVVENSAVKSFDKICGIFEKMAVVTEAQDGLNINIIVDKITLGYYRISEPDSFDTGYIVPVWDFKGTTQFISDGASLSESYGSIMTLNAINGSIIDRSLGY